MFVLGISRGGPRPSRDDRPLDREVVRIGSHPHCAVRFPELEPHTVTIERRAGGVVVHNRTQRVLAIGGEALPAGGQATWTAGAELRLRSDLVVTLDEVEERPSHREASGRGLAAPASHAGGPSGGSLAIQLFVIVASLAGAAAVLHQQGIARAQAAQEERALIGDLMAGDPLCRTVGDHLRRAARAERLGDEDGAIAHRYMARDLLMGRAQRSPHDEHLCRRALGVIGKSLSRR